MSRSLILRRGGVKLQDTAATELPLVRDLNADDIRADTWNPALRLLYTA